MAVAVASTSAAAMVAATSVTVTKPTGLTVGDLMVAIVHCSGTVSVNIQLPSGWTSIVQNSTVGVELRGMYKVADSSDVAASNFTFTGTANSNYMSACMARITGHAVHNVVGTTTDAYGIGSGGGTSVSDTCSVSPTTANSIVFMGVAGSQTNTGVTTSGYTTSNSLSFTEIMDTNGSNRNSAAAYATQSNTTTITTYGATFSAIQDDHGMILFTVTNPESKTGTHTTEVINVVDNAHTITASTNPSHEIATINVIDNATSGSVQNKTVWNNTAKPSTTWINSLKI